jgi:hypothetical protein
VIPFFAEVRLARAEVSQALAPSRGFSICRDSLLEVESKLPKSARYIQMLADRLIGANPDLALSLRSPVCLELFPEWGPKQKTPRLLLDATADIEARQITMGLAYLLSSERDSEVSQVIGHELSHIVLRLDHARGENQRLMKNPEYQAYEVARDELVRSRAAQSEAYDQLVHSFDITHFPFTDPRWGWAEWTLFDLIETGRSNAEIRSRLAKKRTSSSPVLWEEALRFARALHPLQKTLRQFLSKQGLRPEYLSHWPEFEADLQSARWGVRVGYQPQELVGEFTRARGFSLPCQGPGWSEHPTACYRRASILRSVDASSVPAPAPLAAPSLAEVKLEILSYLQKEMPWYLSASGRPLIR